MKLAPRRPTSVLVVDDSAVVRQAMVSVLSVAPDLIVSVASDPFFAMEKMVKSRPDVIVLDLEMPRMDGLTFLRRIMAEDPIPVVVCAGGAERGTEAAMQALADGAVEVLAKPSLGVRDFLHQRGEGLAEVVRAAAGARLRRGAPIGADRALAPRASSLLLPDRPSTAVITLGASTGGPEALRTVLEEFPEDAPGTIVVQHMPAGFTAAFARRLDRLCRVKVQELQAPRLITAGTVLIAPGDRHVAVRRTPEGFLAELHFGDRVSGHRPSIDVLFRSVADAVGDRATAALLTGMGADGARGLLELRRQGACTIAQDEATSVVWGMPKEAIQLGAAEAVLPLDRIAGALLLRARRIEGAGKRVGVS